jgi:ADP-heptose:LPS heptosyltransferase
MGDVVFTLPAVNLLRQNYPHARITYLTSIENQSIVQAFPGVDEVLTIDRALFKHPCGKTITSTFALLKRLRQGKFSLVIDLQYYAETALLARWTGAPQRWTWTTVGNRFRRHAYTHLRPRQDQLHPVDISIDLLGHCGLQTAPIRNELLLPGHGQSEARQFLVEHGLDPCRPFFIIQAFTSSQQKNWPMANYLAVAEHWKARGVQIVFSGGTRDRDVLEPAKAAGFVVCAGAPLSTMGWLLKQCSLVIGGDTGLLHFAVALGTRVIMLMADAGSRTPGPYLHLEWALRPSGDNVVADISIERVNEAVQKIFPEVGPTANSNQPGSPVVAKY